MTFSCNPGIKLSKFFPFTKGGRPTAIKKVIVVTDGQSNRYKHLTIPRAQALKNVGVQIFVVGVGAYIQGIGEMVQMASSPQFLFRVKDYNAFVDVVQLIVKEVDPGKYVILKGEYKPPC